jgi:glyoxylase-like metal-dependent hydrolase (beta-lactamase superfamily II)
VAYTHPHPDHVNGATQIRGLTEVPVYATPDTDRISRAIDGLKREFWTPVYHDDYPPTTTFATVLVKDGAFIIVAGVPFAVHDIGPGECETASLWVSGGWTNLPGYGPSSLGRPCTWATAPR